MTEPLCCYDPCPRESKHGSPPMVCDDHHDRYAAEVNTREITYSRYLRNKGWTVKPPPPRACPIAGCALPYVTPCGIDGCALPTGHPLPPPGEQAEAEPTQKADSHA